MATQGQLLTMIRDRLDEATAIQWTDAQLRQWINEGARDLARRTETLLDVDLITIVAGTREYTVPADVLKINRAEYYVTVTDSIYPLEFRQFNAMDAIWHTQQAITDGTPCYFTLWGFSPNNKVILFPTPSIAGTLKLFVYRLPAELATVDASAAATAIEVPRGWEDLVVDYAEYSALRRDRDPRWAEAKTLYEERIADFWELSRIGSDQGGVITPETNLGLPAWLIHDI